jgi:hypothetical protein
MNYRKYTFWSLLERGRIVIPQIQRDYAYGRNTEKAKNIRNELLNGMFKSLECEEYNPKKTLVLDFVYGSLSKDNSMTPLDGQQRLTTLFLLHLYACIKENRIEKDMLLNFSYETRHSADEFCKSLINDFIYDLESEISLKDQIQNQAKYLNSYDDDPTIQSMLVVFDEIHKKVFNVNDLWDKLTIQKRIIFYYLNLEKFGLTDDLYIKMNSRGKSLTQYEIFKSSLEIFLEEKHPTFKEKIARRLDVEWTNMLWEEDCEIDSGFLNLFINIFIINYYLNNSIPKKIDDVNKCFKEILSIEDDLIFFINSLDAFQKLYKKGSKGISDYYNRFFYISDETLGKNGLIRVFWQSKNNLFVRATSQSLTWAELIMFYALIISLQNEIDENLLFFRFRQLRNLSSNSGDELRPENIHKMLIHTKDLILKGILPDDTFNHNQIIEEHSVFKISDTENNLLIFENHDILRGSLGLFITTKNVNFIDTLKKFSIIFNNNYKDNTPLIRQALLSTGDYSQEDNDPRKRFLVHKSDAWRNFFTINKRRKVQEKIIEIIEKISINSDIIKELEAIVKDYLFSAKKDWRYYFVKYDNQLHIPNTQGYYYWKDRVNYPNEIIILNSSYESESNIEWNIFNLILSLNNGDISTLDNHGASNLILFKTGISINGIQNGFEVKTTNNNFTILSKLIEDNIISEKGVLTVLEEEDYIEKGQELIIKINTLFDVSNSLQ